MCMLGSPSVNDGSPAAAADADADAHDRCIGMALAMYDALQRVFKFSRSKYNCNSR